MKQQEFQPGVEGVWFGLDEDTYRNAPGVNVSALKSMRLSPAHYRWEQIKPREAPTEAQKFGTLVHRAVLEPEKIAGSYVMRPPEFSDYRNKAAQAWRDAQILPILTAEEDEHLTGIVKAVWAIPLLAKLIGSGQKEVSAFKRHQPTGLLRKGRADLVANDDKNETVVFDLKTLGYGEASMEQFGRTIGDWNYHQPAAFYTDLFEAAHFVFIGIEKEPPYGVGIYPLSPTDIELGRRINEAALQRVADGQATNNWPGYSRRMRIIELSAYKRKQDGADLE